MKTTNFKKRFNQAALRAVFKPQNMSSSANKTNIRNLHLCVRFKYASFYCRFLVSITVFARFGRCLNRFQSITKHCSTGEKLFRIWNFRSAVVALNGLWLNYFYLSEPSYIHWPTFRMKRQSAPSSQLNLRWRWNQGVFTFTKIYISLENLDTNEIFY